MPDTGYKVCGTGASVDYFGGSSWTTPTNAQARDTINTASTVPKAGYSDWLRGTNFSFDSVVPAGSTIDGIKVRIRRFAYSGAGIADGELYLWDGSTIIGADHAAVAVAWPNTLTDKEYGGLGDNWGATLTAALIRSSSFGVQIWVGNMDELVNCGARIDCLEMTVYYTAGGVSHRKSSFFKVF